jgi:hypothetical protein
MPDDIVNKMLSFLGGETDEKKALFKQAIKDLSQNKYIKFFHVKSEEADPALFVFFYGIYKTMFPLRVFMQSEEKTSLLRQKIVEHFMDPPSRETVQRLSVEALSQRAGSTAPATLSAEIQADLSKLVAAFDRVKVEKINGCCGLFLILSQLVNFNYPALLKKADLNFLGGNFAVEPKFGLVKLELISKELEDFLTLTHAVNPGDDWETLLEIIKTCAGKELVQLSVFSSALTGLRDILQSKILEFMVQYYLKDPVWQFKPKIPMERAAELWIATKKVEAKKCIDRIATVQKNSQINVLVKQIFGGANVQRLEHYVSARAGIYRDRNLEDFLYADGLNYLKVFLEDFFEKEVRELCDILLIRGQWTNNSLSKEMSEAVHQLMEMSASIAVLDETMSDEGKDGSRLKAAILRVDRDKTQARYINSIIANNNNEALEIINKAGQYFIVIGKQLKMLAEDILKKPADLIINWRELTAYSRSPLAQRMADDCRKINYFVQLMRLCTLIPGD